MARLVLAICRGTVSRRMAGTDPRDKPGDGHDDKMCVAFLSGVQRRSNLGPLPRRTEICCRMIGYSFMSWWTSMTLPSGS